MCWLLFVCFVWPLKVLQTESVLWKAFIELSQLRQTVLWEVSSPSSTDLELFSLERDRTTCHISWELWQMGHSGCCWGVWSCFSPGAEFPILALILGMACLCVVLPRSLSMYLAVCCTCCWKCCALFPPLKKKGSEVEGNIPEAAGWAALLHFLRTELTVA